MSTLHLDDPVTDKPPSQVPVILRTILQTLLAIAIFGSAAANGYFYFQYKDTEKKLAQLQDSVERIDSNSGIGGLERKLSDLESGLSDIEIKIDSVQDDVHSVKRDVGSIESDVSSIQLKVGY